MPRRTSRVPIDGSAITLSSSGPLHSASEGAGWWRNSKLLHSVWSKRPVNETLLRSWRTRTRTPLTLLAVDSSPPSMVQSCVPPTLVSSLLQTLTFASATRRAEPSRPPVVLVAVRNYIRPENLELSTVVVYTWGCTGRWVEFNVRYSLNLDNAFAS